MFFAVFFIIFGSLLLINALGILTINFWGLFWSIFFIALGFKLLFKKSTDPFCGWHYWEEKINGKIHQKPKEHHQENQKN
jgi:hypothetical protein